MNCMAAIDRTAGYSKAPKRGGSHPLTYNRDCGRRTSGSVSTVAVAAAARGSGCKRKRVRWASDGVAQGFDMCSCCCSACRHAKREPDWREAQEVELAPGIVSWTSLRSSGERCRYSAGTIEQERAVGVGVRPAAGSSAG